MRVIGVLAVVLLTTSALGQADRLNPEDRRAWIRSVNSCLDEGHVLHRPDDWRGKEGDGWACVAPANFAINYCVELRKRISAPIKPVDDESIFAEWCLRIWDGIDKTKQQK